MVLLSVFLLPEEVAYTQFSLLLLIVGMCLLEHAIACGWFGIASYSGSPGRQWRWRINWNDVLSYCSIESRSAPRRHSFMVPRFTPRNRQQDNMHQSEVCANLTSLLRSYNAFLNTYSNHSNYNYTKIKTGALFFFCKSRQYPWQLIHFSKTGLRHLGEYLVKDLRPREWLLHAAAGQIKGPRKHPIVSLSFYILSASWLMISDVWWFYHLYGFCLCASCIKLYLHTYLFFYAHTTPALRKHRKSHKEQRNHLWDV